MLHKFIHTLITCDLNHVKNVLHDIFFCTVVENYHDFNMKKAHLTFYWNKIKKNNNV